MSSDFTWHCNILTCRAVLTDRAVVTTCSHIFCLPCAESQGLATSNNGFRICPACETQLVNQDDAVITQLDPSEDYKTSVLSGLHPSIIMECAGRGLAFYSYQVSNEITYQSHLAGSLTEKYTAVNNQLDSIIAQANGQIRKLQDALKDSHARNAEVDKKNWELQEAFKVKAKAHADIRKKYEILKGDKMKDQVMGAASDDAERVLLSVTGNRFIDRTDTRGAYSGQYIGDFQAQGHQRPISASSEVIGTMQRAAPGPLWNAQGRPTQGHISQNQVHATPSTHRTRIPLGPNIRGSGAYSADPLAGLRHESANSMYTNSLGAPGVNGNRMSAGVKMGKRPVSTRTVSRMGPPDLPMRH